MFAVESPEAWFEDFGRDELRAGRAEVALDPDFVVLTGIGDDYHVYLTPEGECGVLYVANRTRSGFEVAEQGGRSNVGFSYRVVARRTDVPLDRFQDVSELVT